MTIVVVHCQIIVAARLLELVACRHQEGVNNLVQSGIVGIYAFKKPDVLTIRRRTWGNIGAGDDG